MLEERQAVMGEGDRGPGCEQLSQAAGLSGLPSSASEWQAAAGADPFLPPLWVTFKTFQNGKLRDRPRQGFSHRLFTVKRALWGTAAQNRQLLGCPHSTLERRFKSQLLYFLAPC